MPLSISSGEAKILHQWGQPLIGICPGFITFGCNFFSIFSEGNNGKIL